MSNLLSDFLNDRIQRIPMSGLGLDNSKVVPYSHHQLSPEENDSSEESDTEQKEFVNRELSNYFSGKQEEVANGLAGLTVVDDVQDDSFMDSEIMNQVEIPKVYTLYNFNSYFKRDLPIDSYKDKIVSLVFSNSVVIIQGPTGCGKTTQVPQYILDNCKASNLPCNIVVTQPRRIAAINLSQRVCEERGWAIGTVCGYQVGLDKKVDENVVLTYVTTEVLLQRLILQKNLNKYTHIIIDEVHERNKTLDFLLLIVRKYLFTNSPKVRIILMSATMKSQEFAYYFRTMGRNSPFLLAPILQITHKTAFSTSIYYIDHLASLLSQNIKSIPAYKIGDPIVSREQYDMCKILIELFDKIDDINKTEECTGSVLVFLPGIHEIEEMHKILAKLQNLDVIPLHSSLSSEHMSKIFQKPKPGIRKIILSTNIAESSVTVPDASYVIDFCLTKVMTVNPITKFSSLSLEWASHNNCIQRAGRVGRVANGRVYRLVYKDFYENELPTDTVPEMQRAPLEKIILYLKQLDLDNSPKNILSLAISPPNLKDIENCVWHLKEVGALLQTCRTEWSGADGDITFLGKIMSSLPIDIHLAKLIVLGHMFGCLEDTVIMAAGSMTRNLFVNSFHEKLKSYKKKLLWSDGSGSDFITLLNLYYVWITSKREHHLTTHNELYAWCKKNFVNYKGLKEWDILIQEIYGRLHKFNIKPTHGVERIHYQPNEKATILKIILCGAFYPNYFMRSVDYGQVDSREAVKILNGRDPCNTVYFTNMKLNQPGQIYVRQIKDLLNADKNVQVGFDNNSSKVYVEFKNVKHPEAVIVDGQKFITSTFGTIASEVYEAVRKRLLRVPFTLFTLPDMKAWEFVKSAQERQKSIDSSTPSTSTVSLSYSPFPPLNCKQLIVYISHVTHIGDFYCHNRNDDTTANLLQQIFRCLNAPEVFLEPLETESSIEINSKLYAAKFVEDMKFYRCKILCLIPGNPTIAQVLFVDYGNVQKVPVDKLYYLPNNECAGINPLAINCTLSGVQPMRATDPFQPWDPKLNKIFRKHSDKVLIRAVVYSIVNDVVHVEVYFPDLADGRLSFNDWLTQEQHAVKCDENYLSKMDHERRLKVQQSIYTNSDTYDMNATKPTGYSDYEAPPSQDLTEIIELKGPFSPLEMSVCGMIQASLNVKVYIDEQSVNVVLLDDKPEDPHARLIVSGVVAQSSQSNVLKIGQTTVMPNIHGLPMMMTLLFCPAMEPKISEDKSKVASVLCGLGCNPNNDKPNYPIHDISLVLDTELTESLILKINGLRYGMNESIKTLNNIFDGISYPEEFTVFQHRLKNDMLSLIRQKQNPIKRTYVKTAHIWSGRNISYEKICMEKKNDQDDIWPMLSFVKLRSDLAKNLAISENLDILLQMAKNLIPIEPISCELCQSSIMNTISDVRVHLVNKTHLSHVAVHKA